MVVVSMKIETGVRLWRGLFSSEKITREQLVKIMIENMFCYTAHVAAQIREPRSGEK